MTPVARERGRLRLRPVHGFLIGVLIVVVGQTAGCSEYNVCEDANWTATYGECPL